MILDKNKGIEDIKYNHLNLPTLINFGSLGTIEYLYSATGQKMLKRVTQGTTITTTDYLYGFQYVNNEMKFFTHAEGFVNVTGGKYNTLIYDYVFNYTDHLGNIRLSFGFDNATHGTRIIEQNHYYPFGLKHTNYNSDDKIYHREEEELNTKLKTRLPAESVYKYKYNGKELQDELGLYLYDYGARNYDPAIGRWMNVDPLAELYYNNNNYMYCNNNPILFMDPNGMYFTKSSYEFINGYRSDLDESKKNNNKSIENLINKISKGGSDNKLKNWADQINSLTKKNDEINTKLSEIKEMEDSNQAYHILSISAEYGITAFVSDMVVIGIPDKGYNKDLLAHELKHGYQFEIGELSISQIKGKNESFLYDKTDEVEGYKRGNENFGISNLPQIYDGLPKGPLNIHNNSEIIKAMSNPDEGKQKQALQNIAKKEKSAFRVNGQTYSN